MKFDIRKFFFRKPNNALEGEAANQSVSVPDDAAISCDGCKAIFIKSDLIASQWVCPKCGKHLKIGARERIKLTCDEDMFTELFEDVEPKDVLGFPDYEEKLEAARRKSGEKSGVVTGVGVICGNRCVVFAMDYRFIMGSMGAAEGEKITSAFEYATENKLPVVGFALSGGARMQEGIVSLMQMAKTSGAVARHGAAGLLYISVLTDPTTGGVSASFAYEGDIIAAEPGALIGFAGPRVIEQTIRQKLPAGFQRAEFVQGKGFVDVIIDRRQMREKLGELLALHAGTGW